MVPDKFNMVDMGGIDLIMMQGEEVPGLYDRLVESIAQCRYQCLYNWLFDGVIIPPTYVELEVNENDEIAINEGVVVTSDDVIHIYSIEPPAPEPEIIPLLVEENGVYSVPSGVDGFNPVTVNVSATNVEEGYSIPSDSHGSDGDFYILYSKICRLNGEYIDTGIPANSIYGFKFVFYPKTLRNSYQSYLSGDTDNFTLGALANLNIVYLWERSSNKGNREVYANEFNIIEKDPISGNCTINGISFYTSIGTLQTNSTSIKVNTNVSGRQSDFMFSECILYNSLGAELCHLLVRDDDIYDSVNGEFYNVGTDFSTIYLATYKKINGHWTNLKEV